METLTEEYGVLTANGTVCYETTASTSHLALVESTNEQKETQESLKAMEDELNETKSLLSNLH